MKSIDYAIEKMKKDRWLIKSVVEGKPLIFYKEFGKNNVKVIKISLVTEGDMLRLVPPNYEHVCRTSYFQSSDGPEERMTLNRVYLESTIRSLKNSGFWDRIVNKEFLIVSEDNKRLNRTVARKILKEMIS